MTPVPTIALLGATGFVGSAVLRELAARPVRIRAVSRRPAAVPPDARADIETRTADLTEPGETAAAVAGADEVVVATLYSSATATWRITDGDTAAERVNVGLVRDLVDALAARRDGPPARVVFTGAASQVGPTAKAVLDGTEPDRPAGPYDRQKLAAERLLLDAAARGVLRGTSLRLPTVFGPAGAPTARDRGVVSAMARRALAGEPLTMWHDGTVRRDLLYVEDLARAVAAGLDHAEALAGRHWLLGTGVGRPLGPVFEEVAALVARRTGRPPVPVVSVKPPEQAEGGDFSSITIDASAFRSVTGWEPRVPFGEALRRTVDRLAEAAEEAVEEAYEAEEAVEAAEAGGGRT
ncbi:NAD-dependent epimerase/dehydratase [Streptomyces sp. JV176]|uniref:NAD-dependent epimerase/dehydratase family protein n=1 Tax=Streptomyces sp. JV176 TaxID=858630 RepID=UPI002E79A662|nr:NAD-dependent epimerase/dehydratase [Streptomyces sp. JV176]MEE1798980.1 NAD-dependent epimerase/dehydratase [Streptomyces sp. JV176]